jgi:hypothetical protein
MTATTTEAVYADGYGEGTEDTAELVRDMLDAGNAGRSLRDPVPTDAGYTFWRLRQLTNSILGEES